MYRYTYVCMYISIHSIYVYIDIYIYICNSNCSMYLLKVSILNIYIEVLNIYLCNKDCSCLERKLPKTSSLIVNITLVLVVVISIVVAI